MLKTTRLQERGVVLLVALIVLGAMALAAIALMRSTLTANRVAGNLAFQQSATQSAEVGIETAVDWLLATNTAAPASLQQNIITVTGAHPTLGYIANRLDPAAGQSWESYWMSSIDGSTFVNHLPTDAAGNTVSFVIHRLSNSAGAPTPAIGCAVPPSQSDSQGNGKGANEVPLNLPPQHYYRITARVVGPRNTVSFVQSVVAF